MGETAGGPADARARGGTGWRAAVRGEPLRNHDPDRSRNRLVREISHPAVRVLYDQANLTFTHGETFEEAFAVQGDLIGHVHVKDLVFTDPSAAFRATETARVDASERAVRSRVVGTGVLPWSRILAALLRHGYDDLLSIEYEYRWHPQDLPAPEDGFRESAAALRGMLTDLAEMENAR